MFAGRVAVVGLLLVAGCEAGTVCGAPGGLCLAAAEATRTHWGFWPDTLQRADVDGDGVADLAGASHVRGTVTVVWGAGAGLGESATTWSVAPEVVGLAVADVDADGRIDVVTTAPGSDEVVVLRGVGGRAFATRRISVGEEPRGVIAARLVEGEAPALVTVNGGGTVSVVRGEEVVTTVVGPEPRALAAEDLDGDGDVDVAVAVAGRAMVQVLLGDGTGRLLPGEAFAVGAAPESVVAADLDGDGAVDLATADVLEGTVSVLYGDGVGGLKAQTAWATGPEPVGLIAVPGAMPLLAMVSRESGGVQTVAPGTGEILNGAAEVRATALAVGAAGEVMYAGAGQVGAMRAGAGVELDALWEIEREDDGERLAQLYPVDLEGDGVDEVVMIFVPGEPTPVPRIRGTVWRDGVLDSEFEGTLGDGVAADLDGDGRRELVMGQGPGVVVLRQGEEGWEVGPPFFATNTVFTLRAADIDGDGRSELLLGQEQQLEVIGMVGEAMQVRASIAVGEAAPGEHVEVLATADGDGDEMLDVMLAKGRELYFGTGLLGAAAVRRIELGVGHVNGFELVDVDEDGRIDGVMCTVIGLAVVRDLLGEATPERVGTVGCQGLAVGAVEEDGRTVATLQGLAVVPWTLAEGAWTRGASARIEGASWLAFAQLDGDGVMDVFSYELDAPLRGWRTRRGVGLVDAPLGWFGGVGPVFAELDGDGVLDAFSYGNGLGAAFGDGAGGFSAVRQTALPGGAQRVNSAAVGDYDEDGRDEVVLSVQPWDGWRSDLLRVAVADDGAMTVTELEQVDRWGARVVAGDLDEDGARDVIVHEEELGLVWLRNTGDGEFAAPQWLAATGMTAQSGRVMDLDDDGRVDFVGFASRGVFALRGLGGGELAPLTMWWEGLARDVTYADLTADGRKDLLMIHERTDQLVLVPGAGAAAAGSTRWLGSEVFAATAADVDADGRPEMLMVTEGRTAGTVTLEVGRWGADGPSFTRRAVASGMEGSGTVTARDFDGDGDVDVGLVGNGDVTIVRQAP